MTKEQWWEDQTDGDEYHTAFVWSKIAEAAEAAGDGRRSAEARAAAKAEDIEDAGPAGTMQANRLRRAEEERLNEKYGEEEV